MHRAVETSGQKPGLSRIKVYRKVCRLPMDCPVLATFAGAKADNGESSEVSQRSTIRDLSPTHLPNRRDQQEGTGAPMSVIVTVVNSDPLAAMKWLLVEALLQLGHRGMVSTEAVPSEDMLKVGEDSRQPLPM